MKNQAPNLKSLSDDFGADGPKNFIDLVLRKALWAYRLSQAVVAEIAIGVLEALVPIEDHVALAHPSQPLDHKVHNKVEVPKN